MQREEPLSPKELSVASVGRKPAFREAGQLGQIVRSAATN